jgi:hypothetical protein
MAGFVAGPKANDVPTVVLGKYGIVSESIRKDSECTFGIGRRRSSCLMLPFLITKKKNVDNISRTCAILHNMLLHCDRIDTISQFDDD